MGLFRGAILGAALFGASCVTAPPTVTVGQSLEVALPRLDGHGDLSFPELRGKVVLVDVWASWCRPCQQSMPFYADLQNAYKDKGFQFVGINVDEDERAAKVFLRENRLELMTLRDPGAAMVGARFGISRMPTAFFIDRQGRVRRTHEGFTAADEPGFRKLVEDLLAEAPDAPMPVQR